MANSQKSYFDLHTKGIGYLNRIREVTPSEGSPFLVATIAALRGRVENPGYTHFECRVTGRKAQEIVRELQPVADGDMKVIVAFKISDLEAETFIFQHGNRAGETGVRLKAQLVQITWAKLSGANEPFYTAKTDTAEAA